MSKNQLESTNVSKIQRLLQDREALSCDYRIMILGVTGAGKSLACNFYLGTKIFKSKGGMVSVTTKSQSHCGDLFGSKVMFIDTPGFSDAYDSNETRLKDIAKALFYAQDGVNAVGICLDGSKRYDSSADETVKQLSMLENFWDFTFVLYTHADDMGDTEEERKKQVLEWLSLERCPRGLKDLLKNVKYRYITVDSKSKDKEYRKQRCKELFSLVNKIFDDNSRKLYNNELFAIAKQNYQKVIAERKKLDEEVEKKDKELDQLQKELNQSDHDKSKQEEVKEKIDQKMIEKEQLETKRDESVEDQCIDQTKEDLKEHSFGQYFSNAVSYVTDNCSVM